MLSRRIIGCQLELPDFQLEQFIRMSDLMELKQRDEITAYIPPKETHCNETAIVLAKEAKIPKEMPLST